MLFEMTSDQKTFIPISSMTISDSIKGSEKDLENYLKGTIGDILFPEYLVFGNERSFQGEADLFAVNSEGDLVVFELKVHGQYDRSKVYQVLHYAQHFSYWRYNEMNQHYKKCFPSTGDLIDAFEEHFGFKIDISEFNKQQKAIVISHSSSETTSRVAKYWRKQGINLEEFFYRFYEVNGKTYFEISNELVFHQAGYNCWINTCRTHFPEAYIDMIRSKKAATYNDRMGVIGQWMSKSFVFLYHNGYGIIAAGKGTANVKDSFNEVIGADERAIKLSHFLSGVDIESKTIKASISASRIKEILQRDFYFPNSVVGLSEGEAKSLFQECEKIFK